MKEERGVARRKRWKFGEVVLQMALALCPKGVS
jgi:hypothetical protein